MRSLFILALSIGCSAPDVVQVGSKIFTESVILGELASQSIQARGISSLHKRELGGTQILWKALLSGEIDVYPEYTGTIREELLSGQQVTSLEEMRAALSQRGIVMSEPLGFNNTYAIGLPEELATRLNIEALSDLKEHPTLLFGFSNEFMGRPDGWPGLQARYQLPQTPTGISHDLAYRAMQSGEIQVTDLYSTDAEIQHYQLKVLRDDRSYFPEYQAVFLYRAEIPRAAIEALRALEGTITDEEMARLNTRAKIERAPEAEVAAGVLGVDVSARDSLSTRLWQRTKEHLLLVSVSLLASLCVALPLGVLSAKHRRLGQLILGVVGVVQTIPALALLVFLIPLFGIGVWPAIVALFLYSLLPIVRNTHAGLLGIPQGLLESAMILELSLWVRLWRIELPLALPQILAGVKTSAVLCIGYATLGALIGAGGYGQPILTGIRLDDTSLLLEGAIPSAVLALVAQGVFELIERRALPRGLRT